MQPIRRYYLLTLLFLSLFGLAQQAPKPADTPPAQDFSKEPFIIESLKSTYHFEADGTGSRRIESKIHLQSDAAVQKLGQLVFSYNSDFEKVTITGRVVKTDGTTVTIPDSAVQDMSSSVSRVAPMYSDVRQKHVIVPSLRPGDTLEYELQYDQFAAMAPSQFWTAYEFNRNFIVRNEELTIDVPVEKYVNVKTRDEFKPETTEKNGRRIYSWKTSHLEREPDSTDKKEARKKRKKKEDEIPAVQVSTFKDWNEIGQWYASLEHDRLTPSDAIRLKAGDLVSGLKTDNERWQALYTYVAQSYRYVSLSFGVGRFQPHPAGEIFINQYGDCKDKHTLLASMANAIGLHAYAALTSASRKVDADFPSPSQFDHVITYVPLKTETIWLDTTSELAPFGLILPHVRGKNALVVGVDGKSGIKEIPEDPAVPDQMIADLDGTVNELGTLDADVRLSMRGDAEVVGRLGVRAVPETKRKDYVTYLAKASGVDGDVSKIEFSDVNDTKKPLEYRFHITKLNYFNRFEKEPRLILPMGSMPLAEPDDSEDDKPFDVGIDRVEYHVKLQLPTQVEVHAPVPIKIDRDYGHYESQYKLEGTTFTGSRLLDLKVTKLSAARLNEYRAFRRTVLSDANQRATVTIAKVAGQDDNADVKVDELLSSAASAFNNGDYQASIDLIERALQKEPKHKSAYNDLGRAYRSLAKYDLAEKALKTATEINPYSPYAYNNLGLVYWNQRRYEEAEKAFQQQIEVDPLDKWAHSNLGEMLIQEKKYAEAEPELQKASTITPDNPGILTALGKAQLNLDKVSNAQESFAKAVNLAPSPGTWNNVAYALAEHKTNLDLAQQYAESAVATVSAQLRNVQLADLKIQQLGSVNFLSMCWDTLGWVHFQKGNLPLAEKYLSAAWNLSQHSTNADHLAQVYERTGQRDKAIELYSLSLAAEHPEPDTKPRLAKLVGDSKVDALIDQHREQLTKMRTFAIPKVKNEGTADFYIALSPGSKVEDVRYISGSDKLKDLAASIKQINFNANFPDANDTRIVRRGTLACAEPASASPVVKASNREKDDKTKTDPQPIKPSSPGPCTFVLQTPESVRTIN